MIATINGSDREVAADATVASLLDELGIRLADGVAVAVNERVVPRARFDEHALAAGDRIEIIRPVAGG